jgi:hypothetical protein
MIFYGKENLIASSLSSLAGTPARDNDNMDLYRIRPAPQVSISTDYKYSGDNAIGAKYSINLDGIIVDRFIVEGSVVDQKKGKNPLGVLDLIHKLRAKLNYQGGAIFITDEEYNTILIARGGSLKNFSVNNSTDNWSTSAPYSATIEFQELDFQTAGSNSLFMDEESLSTALINANKYKINSFSDNWSFDFDEEIYSDMFLTDTEYSGEVGNLNTSNLAFNVSYDIEAVGAKFYNSSGELIPEWESAKDFCQKRLSEQITRLIENVLGIDLGHTQCSSTKKLEDIYSDGDDGTIIGNASFGSFNVYNEEINCSTSESNGSFKAQYKCYIRLGNTNFLARHKITKDIAYENKTDYNINKTYSIKGSIEGLVLGGLSKNLNGIINLPASGSFMVSNPSGNYNSNPKYDNALNAASYIINPNFTDLSDNMKDELGITHSNLMMGDESSFCGNNPSSYPLPTNFTVVNDYNAGTINYTANFDSSISCGGNYSNISMSINSPVLVTATFLFPNGDFITPNNPQGVGCLIQSLGTYTKATMDINISGRDNNLKLCCNPSHEAAIADINALLTNGRNDQIIYPQELLDKLPSLDNAILTKETKNVNIYTGEYSYNLSYILCTAGCF